VVHVYDVVIVGAGPGGAATAHFSSQSGLDVLLLDRSAFPRDKTCGDGLTPRALRVLDRMHILDRVARVGCRVDGYEVVAPNRRSTTAAIGSAPGALVVPRVRLDHMIVERAVESGAHFESSVRVSHVEATGWGTRVHSESGHTFDARVAVIATGAASSVLRRSGILRRQPRAMLAARAYVEDLQHEVARTFQLRFDDAPMPGYGWVFPIGPRAANVGVGFLPGRRGPHSTTAPKAYERFTRGAALQQVLAGGRQAGPLKGYPIRVDFLGSPTCAERTLLVGEAAGLVNPLTGEGIDYALESGMLAAEHVVLGLQSGPGHAWLAEYDRLLRARFEKIFHFSQWVRDWYCRPPLLNVLVPLANRRPELRQLLASIVLGEREPRGYGPVAMLARLMVYLARHPGVPQRD
jgi:geranylgeranyl reductase family protein